MPSRNMSALYATLVVLFIANSLFFTVQATERAVLLRFGEVVDADLKPGLHFKIPLVHEVRRFDARLQVSDAERTEFLTKESKFLIIDAYVMWRVNDVKRYFTATGGLALEAESRLMPLVRDGLKNRVSERDVHEVVAGQREQLMQDLTKAVNTVAMREFGIEVVDVRVKRVDFPNSTVESIYNRMRTEREREAREHRAQGTEMSDRIKSDADRQQRVILADAYRQAETLRGEGDADAASIARKAFGQNAEFYDFYRSLQAYRNSFNRSDDVLVLKGDSEFLKYMRKPGK
ncbi:protease FtsH subunit HflC [Paraperlucidibaca baekdonensis]|uniref:Protein HflC n=1 Tax=Paraperlucidibaca baekdonensis TaxID=748120 RepID=A0A3E0H8M1_9GAMM|nr:protease modulator HflC [Paraperlucidibaca baekdonensis]REH39933.1 protease FtsH subunit HflC [Paraperlucidibaca baekdonensis]